MNVFIIGSPLETAMALDKRRLNKQIIECLQMLDAIDGKKAWSNHPCTLQYAEHRFWLRNYMDCLAAYSVRKTAEAQYFNFHCDQARPPFHTEEFFTQMKRRLYTKDSAFYCQWAHLGTSDENWYWSPKEQKIIKYVNGKRQD